MKIVNVQISVTYLYSVVDGDDVVPQQDGKPFAQAQFVISSLSAQAFHGAFCNVAAFRERLEAELIPRERRTEPIELEEPAE